MMTARRSPLSGPSSAIAAAQVAACSSSRAVGLRPACRDVSHPVLSEAQP